MKYEPVELVNPTGRYRVDLLADGERFTGPVFIPNAARSAREAAIDYANWCNSQHARFQEHAEAVAMDN